MSTYMNDFKYYTYDIPQSLLQSLMHIQNQRQRDNYNDRYINTIFQNQQQPSSSKISKNILHNFEKVFRQCIPNDFVNVIISSS